MTVASSSERRVAVLEIGSNAARLSIYLCPPNRPPRLAHQARVVTRLGAGDRAAAERALKAAVGFMPAIRRHDAREVIAVGTAAVRTGAAGRILVRRFGNATGHPLRVLSGAEEARLVYMGLAQSLPADRPGLIVDIGGGSTEVIVGDRRRCHTAVSLPLGAVRLAAAFPALREERPVAAAVRAALCGHIRQTAAAGMARLRRYGATTAAGVGGTVRSLAYAGAGWLRYPAAAPPAGAMPAAMPWMLMRRLAAIPLPLRRQLPGMDPGRADIIIAGAAILSVIMSRLRIVNLRVSRCGLRDGLLIEHLNHNPL